MYLSSDEQNQTSSAPSISTLVNWGMSCIVVGLIGLIVFESIRLTHKPTTAFNRFIEVADLSDFNKCLKNKGGDGCRKYLVKEWEKINGD